MPNPQLATRYSVVPPEQIASTLTLEGSTRWKIHKPARSLARSPSSVFILTAEVLAMRRLCTLFVIVAAFGLSAQTATEERPQLVQSVDVQPGDSPLVRAAKRAVANRQNAKDRVTVKVTGTGHLSQPPGPAKELKMPPPLEVSAPTPASASANANRARNEEIERKIKALQDEQKRLGEEADQPYAGDVTEEDNLDRRMATIQQQIDELRKQLKGSATPPRG